MDGDALGEKLGFELGEFDGLSDGDTLKLVVFDNRLGNAEEVSLGEVLCMIDGVMLGVWLRLGMTTLKTKSSLSW